MPVQETAQPPLLRVSHVHTQLGKQSFGPFSFQLSPGERLAIIGPSGAGKSTLLSLLSRERPVKEGSISLRAHPLTSWSFTQLSQIRAVLPQQHEVAFGLTGELIIRLGRVARRSDPQQTAIIQSAARLAEASHLLQRRFDTLSGGEKARIHLARVFAQLWDTEQGLLLVDEPLAALDPGLQLSLMSSIQTFVKARQHALIAILHDMNQALQSFDQVLMIKSGQQVGCYSTREELIDPLADLYEVRLGKAHTPDGQSYLIPLPMIAEMAA